MSLTAHEYDILQTTSRVSSALSLLGATIIIVTFCTSRNFSSRPITRLVFYASFGNIVTNVATIVSRDGIRAGQTSSLCQAQGFLLQWAVSADALFCFAMAVNVYLTVCRKRTTPQLRKLEPLYVVLCYGIPLIPALVFLLVRPKRGLIYGNATLWCWIDAEWNILRIAAFYAPVWVFILFTFFIYLVCGRIIFKLRRKLRVIQRENELRYLSPKDNPPTHLTLSSPTASSAGQSSPCDSAPPHSPPGPKSTLAPPDKIVVRTTVDTQAIASQTAPTELGLASRHSIGTPAQEASYICTITTSNCDRDRNSGTGPQNLPSHRSTPRLHRTTEANRAAWAYCRCAMLFFIALVATWLPSSINRIYQFQNHGKQNFGLLFVGALVIPLQGFWNVLIYIVTTYPAVRIYITDIAQAFSRVSASFAARMPRSRNQQHFQVASDQRESVMISDQSRDSLPLCQSISVTRR